MRYLIFGAFLLAACGDDSTTVNAPPEPADAAQDATSDPKDDATSPGATNEASSDGGADTTLEAEPVAECSHGDQACADAPTDATPPTEAASVVVPVCRPGSTRCNGDRIQTCNASAQWDIPVAPCQEGCAMGVCVESVRDSTTE